MPYFCVTINGQRHCFEIPLLVELSHIRKPDPGNYPALDLAFTVNELLRVVQPLAPNSSIVRGLAEVSGKFIREVQAGLPKGVELVHDQAVQSKSV